MLANILAQLESKPIPVPLPDTCVRFLLENKIPGDIIADIKSSSFSGWISIGPLSVAPMAELVEQLTWEPPFIEIGLLVLAVGANGDPVAVNRETRRMVFISHDEMDYDDLNRSPACVQETPFLYEDFWEKVVADEEFPCDYYEARDRWQSDGCLKDLCKFKGLTSLQLCGVQITDAGLNDITQLENLTKLYIFGTQISDVGMKAIGKLTNLTELRLTDARISDAGIEELRGLEKLTQLNIGGIPITEAGLHYIFEIKSLKNLSLDCLQITDEGLNEIGMLVDLTNLRIADTNLSDANMKAIGKLTNLKDLTLECCRITDIGLQAIKELPNLESLNLTLTKVKTT